MVRRNKFSAKEGSVVETRGELDKYILEITKRARESGVKTKEELVAFLKKDSPNLNERMVKKILNALNKNFVFESYKVRKNKEGEFFLNKEGEYNSVQTAFLNTYFELVSKGEVPSWMLIQKKMREKGYDLNKKSIEAISKSIDIGLPLLKKQSFTTTRGEWSSLEGNVLKLNKESLEKGKPYVVRDLDEGFVEKACINLFEREWKIKKIAEKMGLPEQKVTNIIKQYQKKNKQFWTKKE